MSLKSVARKTHNPGLEARESNSATVVCEIRVFQIVTSVLECNCTLDFSRSAKFLAGPRESHFFLNYIIFFFTCSLTQGPEVCKEAPSTFWWALGAFRTQIWKSGNPENPKNKRKK